MFLSYSDYCFHDLAFAEKSEDPPNTKTPANLVVGDDEISIAGFIEYERRRSSAAQVIIDSSSRSRSVSWILKGKVAYIRPPFILLLAGAFNGTRVRAFYGFQAVTAYLAVNYLDRFLSSHHLPETGVWPLQLLSVACLSLAAKMEESLVPSLLDLQVEGTKFIFEPKTIQRMELLVLDVLDWRLHLLTPFSFISFFSHKLDASGTHTKFLTARSTDIILTYIQEASFLEYRASSIAAGAILCAASEMPTLSSATPENAESWCDGLSEDMIKDCYRLIQRSVADHTIKKSVKVIPRVRVTAEVSRVRSYIDSPSSSSTPTTSSYNNKKRRLNNDHSWVDDDY